MSDEHKEALAQGRRQSHAVRRYLEALAEETVSGPRTAAVVDRELEEVRAAAQRSGIVERLELVQRRMNLEEERRLLLDGRNLHTLEVEFIDVARSYSERKGITFDVWRELGVPESVLRQAGVAPGD